MQYVRQMAEKVIFFLIFFVVIAPVGFVMRLWGRDRLSLKEAGRSTFFHDRDHRFGAADLEHTF